jgi:hypothetical protein
LADQVSRLYDLIGGYDATQLIEIARQLGVCGTRSPGATWLTLGPGCAPLRGSRAASGRRNHLLPIHDLCRRQGLGPLMDQIATNVGFWVNPSADRVPKIPQ